ncbi:DNA polymerase [Megasphaera elsdenii]|uniref:DNA polymerase n=1 Tax=Megasphaera elsdenii TaxID=907 RepID=UPI003D055C8B
MRTLAIDLETYSSNDIKYSVYKYVEAPDFEILLFAYAFDDDPVRVVDLAQGETLPDDVKAALYDKDVLKTAFNANFEINCLKKYFPDLPEEQWECDRILSLYNSYPPHLAAVAKAMHFDEDRQKDTRGKALIRYFCLPCKPTKANGGRTRNYPKDAPDKWETFKEYNRQDVVVERAIRDKLVNLRPPDFEHENWLIDQAINRNGIMVNRTLVDNAIRLSGEFREKLLARAMEITGLDNPNSPLQVKGWLEGRLGRTVDSLSKAAVADLLAEDIPGDVREMLSIRQKISKSSIKKYDAMRLAACKDNRIRGMFQFYGAARTGRFAGRIVQLQNLPRNSMPDLDLARNMVLDGDLETLEMCYEDVQDVLSQLIRTALEAPPGKRFIVADFSAIEARVIAWLAGEEWEMKAFAEGKDIYCATASAMFGVPVVKHGVNGELRQKGKVAVLACLAEGQLVLTDKGLIPIEKVTKDMKVWDGQQFVHHDGVIYKGERKVITYEGLTATPDHLVWIEGNDRPVHFIEAAQSGAHLLRSGFDRTPQGTNHPGCAESGTRKAKELARHTKTARVYDIKDAGPNHRFTVSGKLVHNCGYGGGIGALKAMGADKMGLTDDELQTVVRKWREASPHIVKLWADVENAAMNAVSGIPTTIKQKNLHFHVEDDALYIELPSGRHLVYLHPHLGKNRFGSDAILYTGLGGSKTTAGRWGTLETYGGKLVENCLAQGTLVLTDRGLVPIEKVSKDTLVWDGISFIRHEGIIDKGVQDCITVDGLVMTPDHRILTEKGWMPCVETQGLNWADVRLPHRHQTGRKHERWEIEMAVPLRLRPSEKSSRIRPEKEKALYKVMRLHERAFDWPRHDYSRVVAPPHLGRMALIKTAMSEPTCASLQELRGPRHNGLRAVARKFPEFPGRYGALIQARTPVRPDRQQQRLLAGKLSLGYIQRKFQEQTNKSGRTILRQDDKRTIRRIGYQCDNAMLSAGPQLAAGIIVDKTKCKKRVYDIRNCGPRHRFAVYDPETKKVRLVHNCVQAIARDCLCAAMKRLTDAGYKICAHIHDEVILEMPEGRGSLDEAVRIMCQNEPWNEGLVMNADGFEAKYYQKD